MDILKSSRAYAADIVHKVMNEGAYANLALSLSLRDCALDARDRRYVTHLVYGTLRQLTPLDYQLSCLLAKPLRSKDAYLHTILRCAAFELLYSNASAHAVVNEWVELAKRRGNPGWGKLCNGVLRNLLRRKESLSWPQFADELQRAAFFQSIPDWLAALWRRERGEDEALALIAALAEPSPLCLRVNARKTTRSVLLEALTARGIEAECCTLAPQGVRCPGHLDVTAAPGFAAGEWTVQAEASQLAAYLLAPQPGSRLLDMCAAPGGKATYLAELMDDRGEVVAADVHEHKLELIAQNAARLGLQSVQPLVKDGRDWGKECPAAFDGILLDAPCSGLGVLGHRIDSRFRKQEGDIDALAALQFELLTSAAQALKPGGTLIYSTCTVSRRENEDNRARFLREQPAFRPLPFADKLRFADEATAAAAAEGQAQLLPHLHGTDGFYIAAFQKEEA